MAIRPYRDPVDEAPRVAHHAVVVVYTEFPRWVRIMEYVILVGNPLLLYYLGATRWGYDVYLGLVFAVIAVLISAPVLYWGKPPPTVITVDHSAGHLVIRRRGRWPGRPLVRTVRLPDVLAVEVVADGERGEEVAALRLVNGDLHRLFPKGNECTKHHEAVAAQLRAAIMSARALPEDT